jgi:hypothetical protein
MRRGWAANTTGIVTLLCGWAAGLPALHAQQSQPAALQMVRAAVASELAAAQADHMVWMYRDHDIADGKDAVYLTVETPQGTLRRMIELNGRPVTPAQEQAETQRLNQYVHDREAQARAHKNSTHDDDQATKLLKMLPDAFLWSIGSDSPEAVTLDFAPNPAFHPPDMEARVFGAMGGQMVVTHRGDRIATLRGKLLTEIVFGLAMFGKLDKGGTFDVERRQVSNGYWEIAETHVHIGGHAQFFKTIGQQEDEVKTDWRPSPDTTLAGAQQTLSRPSGRSAMAGN